MVRKFIELPYAGSIICTKKNGWENKVIHNTEYPMLDTSNDSLLDKQKMLEAYEMNIRIKSLEQVSRKFVQSTRTKEDCRG